MNDIPALGPGASPCSPLPKRDDGAIAESPVTRLTWWGHSTTTVTMAGVRLLTDPVLTQTVAHLRRRRGPLPTAAVREVDAVLLSHLHADHLHPRSLASLPTGTKVLAPRGALAAVRRLDRLDLDVVELDPGDVVDIGGVQVRAVPAAHDGRRWPGARKSVTPLGFVLAAGTMRTWFPGDTDLSEDVIAAVGPCAVALVPVGGWGPGLGLGHLDARRAAEAVAQVSARHAVPIHWGTLWPIGLSHVARQEFVEPGPDFLAHAAEIAPATAVHLLEPGQSVALR